MPPKRSLDQLIVAYGLEQHADLVRSLRLPCARVIRKPVDQDDLAPTSSRLGGLPHLPPTHEWPIGPRGPMNLLAQINLADAAPHDAERLLPAEGMLYFWYDFVAQPWGYKPEHRAAFRVEHLPRVTDDLELRTCPPSPSQDLDSLKDAYVRPEDGAFAPCSVTFRPGETLPDREWIQKFAPHAKFLDEMSDVNWGTPYDELASELRSGAPRHLLGHAATQQGPFEMQCQLASSGVDAGHTEFVDPHRERELLKDASDWRLLLQLHSDEDGTGWEWGDGGVLFYSIRRQDLAARDFSKCWVILQT